MKIFISHANKDCDNNQAKAIHKILEANGYEVFLDLVSLQGGDKYPSEIAYGIIDSDLFIFLVSEYSIEETCKALKELEIAGKVSERKDIACKKNLQILPVNISDRKIKDLEQNFPPLIKNLTCYSMDDSEVLEYVLKNLPIPLIFNYSYNNNEGSKTIERNNKNLPPCPYRALYHFEPGDYKNFFGRDHFIEKLEDKIINDKFVTVVGPSGIGKSSVVLAGLIPKLHQQKNIKWLFTYFRPDNNPFAALASALYPLFNSNDFSNISDLITQLQKGSDEFSSVFEQIQKNIQQSEKRVLIVADQFGKLFSCECAENILREFINSFTSYIKSSKSSPRITWILTRTSADLDSAFEYPELWELLRSDPIHLEPMKTEDLKAAIELPAKRFYVDIEKEVINELVINLETQPGSLALLEFVMWKLWATQIEKEQSKNFIAIGDLIERKITIKGYHELEKLDGIFSIHADKIFSKFGPEDKKRIRKIFIKLTRIIDGESRVVSRVVSRAEMGESNWELVETLADEGYRLLVIFQKKNDEGLEESVVEIIHEILLNSWTKIREWNQENDVGLRRIDKLNDMANDWKKNRNIFINGERLEDEKRFINEQREKGEDIPKLIDDFLQKSAEKEKSDSLKQFKKILFIVTVAVVIVVKLGYFWWDQSNEKSKAEARLSLGEEYFIETTNFKRKGVVFFKEGKYPDAIEYFRISREIVRDDPEVSIYFNNAIILNDSENSKRSLLIAVSVPIATSQIVAKEILRGVAQVQIKWNKKLIECYENKDQKNCQNLTPLLVVIGSDDNKSDVVKNIAKYLVNEEFTINNRKKSVLAVVGHNATNASMSGISSYQGSMVMITPTSFALDHNRIQDMGKNKGNYIFTMAFPITSLVDEIKRHMHHQADGKKIKVLVCFDSEADDQKKISDYFHRDDEYGIEKYTNDECNFSNPIEGILDRAKEAEVTHLYMAPHVNTIADSILLAKHNKNQQEFKLFSSPTLYTADTLLSGDYVSGLTLAVYWHPEITNKEGHFFLNAALDTWGEDARAGITWRSALAYDATEVIMKGMDRELLDGNMDFTRKNLQERISRLMDEDEMSGVTGKIKFSKENGQRLGKSAYLVGIEKAGEDYKFVPIK